MNATANAIERTQTLDLAALRRMSFKELETLYRAGKRPSAVSDLDGDAKGAVLAIRSLSRSPLHPLLQSIANLPLFPWLGKSFKGHIQDQGEGINRINLLSRKAQWFPFETRFAASFLDAKPTLILDYGRPGNPLFIRQIVDEVREVAPGLYLGPAALRISGKPRPVLFFALSYQ